MFLNTVVDYTKFINDTPQVYHAGIGILITTLVIVASGVALGFLFKPNQDFQNDSLSPNSLSDFNMTLAKEGTVIPLCYGTVRTEGNILWYDNLQTEEIIIEQEEPEGGKGGGGGSSTSSGGYRYYLDWQQGIAEGKYTLVETYINDKLQTVSNPPNPGFEDSKSEVGSYADNIIFNDGTNGQFLAYDTYSNALTGVCHITYERFYLGDNVNNAPTIHYVITRDMSHSPVSNHTLSNGTNPAAIIYDLLIYSGIPIGEIDLTSFNAAANYWASKGYGLNIKFSSQSFVTDMIAKVLSYVDGVLFQDFNGVYNLRALDPLDSSVRTLTDSDYKNFKWTAATWEDVPNEFRGTFTAKDYEFSKRVVFVDNPAAIFNAGNIKKKESIELGAFSDITSSSKRMFQLMQNLSYPGKVVSFITSHKNSDLLPGDVITIDSVLHGISGMVVRIQTVDEVAIENNEIQFTCREMIEQKFEATYTDISEPNFVAPVVTPVPLTKTDIFELPYTTAFQEKTAMVALAARENLNETAFNVYSSLTSGSGFSLLGTFRTFSQYGVLNEQYILGTNRLDKTRGILYTPYKYDSNLSCNQNLSFNQLFTVYRFAIINDEMIAFQTQTPEGLNDYRLTNCIRGVLNTPVQTHNIGDKIWLVSLSDNVITGLKAKTNYFQIFPIFGNTSLSPPQTEKSYVTQDKAKKPITPPIVRVVRVGLNLTIDVFCASPGVIGSSTLPAESYTDQYPFDFKGDFLLTYLSNTDVVYTTSNNIQITLPGGTGALTLDVKSRLNTFVSSAKQVSIGSTDGTYLSTS